MFIHSDQDYRCWIAEPIQMFYALKPVSYTHLYAFHNAGRVIECLRLKSCGFHSREIRQIFASVSSDELMTMMQENADQLKKEMMQKQVSYQGHQALAAWAARTKDNLSLIHISTINTSTSPRTLAMSSANISSV